jgi:hypothetical protein
LQSNSSHKSRSSRKSQFYKEARSKIIGILGRGSEESGAQGDPSDDDIDLSRWSAISEARDTSLLKKEPKSISKRHGRLPFRTFGKGEAFQFLPKSITALGHSQNRSYTPPQNRTHEGAHPDGKEHRQKATRSASKEDARKDSRRSPRCRSPHSIPSMVSSGSTSYLMGVLDTASNERDARTTSGSPHSISNFARFDDTP